MSDSIFRRCARCGGFVRFVRPPYDPDTEDPAEQAELVAWGAIVGGVGETEHAPGECPNEIEAAALAALGNHSWYAEVSVYRDGEQVARAGSGTFESPTFGDIVKKLSSEISDKWSKVVAMGAALDDQGGDGDGGNGLGD